MLPVLTTKQKDKVFLERNTRKEDITYSLIAQDLLISLSHTLMAIIIISSNLGLIIN